ncbi:stress-related protein isoform X2 [Amborella trichopoda]|uniref:Stress-related protein n=1 Tax=Amborella trichopoda TaxID=13333 RepID=W1PIX1_AMBTC|nr:stress-related protein isoform X2 [Amborella trichopoda]ERN09937.1 hypothetical protein AMTR_s00013p00185970 [Amborella trichopoda]|eukprot:XP_006848356.1 stress-related protein isoform X2 [Amborella trichopoda]
MEAKTEPQDLELKYLGFIKIAAIKAIICILSLYEYAKGNSGSIRSHIDKVEGHVKTVVGPVYEKVNGVPLNILKFIDGKVDENLGNIQQYAPEFVKGFYSKASSVARKAPELYEKVATDIKERGAAKVGKEACAKYKPIVEDYAIKACFQLQRLPFLAQVAQVAGPTAGFLCFKYNHLVSKGYAPFCYLPRFPLEEIIKAINGVVVEKFGSSVSEGGEGEITEALSH